MLNSEEVIASDLLKLRDDKYTLLFGSAKTTKDFLLSIPKDFKIEIYAEVFGESIFKSSKTMIDFSCAFNVKADLRANRFTFLFTFWL